MIPESDMHSLKSLVRAARGGTLDAQRLAEKAYAMGSEACHKAVVLVQPETLNIAELEKHTLKRAIEQTSGNIPAAARLVGIGKTTVYRKVKEYGIDIRPAVCPNCGSSLLCAAPVISLHQEAA